MPAGEERSAVSSRWSLKMMEIHKYASNTNTNTQGKTRNTQIQKYKHTQIQILLLAVWARSEEEKNEIFWKKCSHENGRNFCSRIISKGPRVPKRTYSTGLIIPKQYGVSQKSFYGGKVVRSFKKLGEDRICSSSARSPLDSIQI